MQTPTEPRRLDARFCYNRMATKIDTPLMLTPLLSLGPGRLGIDLEAEALNNGICLRTGCVGERRCGRRRSIAELEARAEAEVPFYSLPLLKPGHVAAPAAIPQRFTSQSNFSTADEPRRPCTSPNCVTSPFTGGWLRGDDMALLQEFTRVDAATSPGGVTAAGTDAGTQCGGGGFAADLLLGADCGDLAAFIACGGLAAGAEFAHFEQQHEQHNNGQQYQQPGMGGPSFGRHFSAAPLPTAGSPGHHFAGSPGHQLAASPAAGGCSFAPHSVGALSGAGVACPPPSAFAGARTPSPDAFTGQDAFAMHMGLLGGGCGYDDGLERALSRAMSDVDDDVDNGSAEPPSMEALLADDSCACSEAMMAAATSAGTSSRRIAPGRTMVVYCMGEPPAGDAAAAPAGPWAHSSARGRRSDSARSSYEGCGEAESLFLDVSALVPEADLGGGSTMMDCHATESGGGGLPAAFRGAPGGYAPAAASTRAGGPPRRAAAMNRRPASALLMDDAAAAARRAGRRAGEYAHITQDMLKDGGFFDMPIQEAAAQLGIGLSVLKRVCRTIGLARWPYRKRQSLRNVVEQTKLYLNGMDFASKDKVLRLLEQAAASLDGSTGEDLGPAFKRYRQAVFKLNYKINKLNAGKRGAAKGTGVKCRVAIPKSAAASLEALANFALDGDAASAAALAPEDMDLVKMESDDGAGPPLGMCGAFRPAAGSAAAGAFGVAAVATAPATGVHAGMGPAAAAAAAARAAANAAAARAAAAAAPAAPAASAGGSCSHAAPAAAEAADAAEVGQPYVEVPVVAADAAPAGTRA